MAEEQTQEFEDVKLEDFKVEGQPLSESSEETEQENTEEETNQEHKEENKDEVQESEKEEQESEQEESDEGSEDNKEQEEGNEEEVVDFEEALSETLKEEVGFETIDDLKAELEELRQQKEDSAEEEDEFLKGFIENYKNGGDVTKYLEAKSVNYEEMSDQDILKREYREKYPSLSEKALNRKFEKDMESKYTLDEDSYDPEDVELGKELLHQDADEARKRLIKEQESYKIPEKKAETATKDQEDTAQQLEKWREQVLSNDNTKTLTKDKQIEISGTDGEYSFEVENPEDIVEMTVDNQKFFGLFKGEDGGVDLNKFYRAANYAMNPDGFEKSLIEMGKSIASKDVEQEIKNPRETGKVNKASTSNSGDEKEALLKEFLENGSRR